MSSLTMHSPEMNGVQQKALAMAEAVKKQQDDHSSHIKNLVAAKRTSLHATVADVHTDINYVQRTMEEKSEYQQTIAELQSKHEEELQRVRAHAEQVTRLAVEEALQAKRVEHDKSTQALREEMEAKHRQELEEQEEALMEEKEAAIEEYMLMIDNMKTDHENAMKKLEESMIEKQNARHAEVQALQTGLADQTAMVDELSAALELARNEHDLREAEGTKEVDEALMLLEREHQVEIDTMRRHEAELEEQLEAVKRSREREASQLRSSHAEQVERIQREAEETVRTALESESKKTHVEHALAVQQMKEELEANHAAALQEETSRLLKQQKALRDEEVRRAVASVTLLSVSAEQVQQSRTVEAEEVKSALASLAQCSMSGDDGRQQIHMTQAEADAEEVESAPTTEGQAEAKAAPASPTRSTAVDAVDATGDTTKAETASPASSPARSSTAAHTTFDATDDTLTTEDIGHLNISAITDPDEDEELRALAAERDSLLIRIDQLNESMEDQDDTIEQLRDHMKVVSKRAEDNAEMVISRDRTVASLRKELDTLRKMILHDLQSKEKETPSSAVGGTKKGGKKEKKSKSGSKKGSSGATSDVSESDDYGVSDSENTHGRWSFKSGGGSRRSQRYRDRGWSPMKPRGGSVGPPPVISWFTNKNKRDKSTSPQSEDESETTDRATNRRYQVVPGSVAGEPADSVAPIHFNSALRSMPDQHKDTVVEVDKNNVSPASSVAGTATNASAGKRRRATIFASDDPADVQLLILNMTVTDRMKNMVKSLGISLVEDTYAGATSATHVIAGDADHTIRRTAKLLIALCCTANILHVDWLIKSHAMNQLMNPLHFLLLNDEAAERKYRFSMKHTLREGRERRKEGGLFAGWFVYICDGVAGNKAPKLDALSAIVNASGGSVLDDFALPLDEKYAKHCLVITSDPAESSQTSDERVEQLLEDGAKVFTVVWMMKCITHQKLIGVKRPARHAMYS